MRRRWLGALLAAAVSCALAAVPSVRGAVADLAGADERRFPHAEHAGLFPSCLGCHGGVLAEDTTTVPLMGERGTSIYPTRAQCEGCHDGVQQARVEWDQPAREPSNLRFSHAEHNREADLGDPAFNCGQCHQQRGTTAFMAVAEARPPTCIACHGHPAPSHLAESSPCRTCHRPLTRAVALTPAQIADFPEPPSHREPGFIVDHAPSAAAVEQRCSVCHARESCERCHANAPAVAQIAALPRDARVGPLVAGRAPEYPVPASHREPEWPYAHGDDARARIASCANCHTQPGCRSCHTGTLGARAIARLPQGDDGPRGVRLRGHDPVWPSPPAPAATRVPEVSNGDVMLQGAPAQRRDTVRADSLRARTAPDTARRVRVHPPGFATRHGPAAGAERLSCSGCHETKRFCTECHDGEDRRRFHPPNFVARHPTDAYARAADCSSCHSREAFCGACHQRSGLQSEGRLNVAFHTAQPLWLIQHGRAARTGLESCTTCHVQRDCMQCHSIAGWSVNPHGPGFDPGRMSARNAQTCRACHLGPPPRR